MQTYALPDVEPLRFSDSEGLQGDQEIRRKTEKGFSRPPELLISL
jgi:hypothetical protein